LVVRVRIAPSPTGDPHIGTAYVSLFNFAFARQKKGKFILRIEDTDRSRLVEGTEKKILDSLKWLNLFWDEGPDISGSFKPYRQSERLSKYKQFAIKLVENNKAYYCDCSPERLKQIKDEQQKNGELTHYDRKCRNKGLIESSDTVIRLAVPAEGSTKFKDEVRGEIIFQNKDIDDQVLLKSDGFPTYHLASVVDDHLMEISHVIRAEEWLSSTPKHVLLYQAFGWQIPTFVHLPLLRNPDRSKISKRKNPVSLTWYKDQGYLPLALLNYLATMGWSMPDGKEVFSLDDFINSFTFDRIDPAGPVFDLQKLDWMNGVYIRNMDNQELAESLKEFSKRSIDEIKKVLPLVKERMKKLSDFDSLTDFIFKEEVSPDPNQLVVKKYGEEKTAASLLKVAEEMEKASSWSDKEIEEAIESERSKVGWTRSEFYMPVRVAVSASTTTPPLFETIEAIGKDKTVRRLKNASKKLSK